MRSESTGPADPEPDGGHAAPDGRADARADRLRTLTRLNRLISSSLDTERILREIALAAAALMDTAVVSFWIVDEGTRTLRRRAYSDARLADSPLETLAFGEGLVGWVAEHRQLLHVPDVSADARTVGLDWWRRHDLRSWLGVPIALEGTLLAVLALADRRPFRLDREEEELLQGFVDQAATAIRNIQSFAETDRRRRAAEALVEVGAVLSQTLDPVLVGQRVVDAIRTLLEGRSAMLFGIRPDSGDMVLLAVSGEVGPGFRAGRILPKGTGLAGIAVREQHPVVTSDVLADPRITLTPEGRVWIGQAQYRAVLTVPLVVQGRVIGVLGVGDRPARVFGPDEIRMAQVFASQAAAALENARLFEESERRRREAEVVAELARDINAVLDVETLLQRVADGAKELCDSDMAQIAVRDPGTGAMTLQYWAGYRERRFEPGRTVEPGKGVGGQVLLTGRPFRTDRYAEDPRITKDYLEWARREGTVASMAVPIRAGDRLEGLVAVINRTPRSFTDRDETTLLRLADHAAIAIGNARLLEELRTHETRLEGLLEISRQLSRIQPVESLLDAVAAACGRLLHSDSVGFRLVEGDELVVAGLWGDALQTMPTPRLKMGESLSGIVAVAGEPLIVPDLAADPRLISAHREAVLRLGNRAWLGMPVKLGDRVVGVLSIRVPIERGFSDRDVAIATAFASQAATALENARLYAEAQRAYEEVARTQGQLVQAQKMEAVGRLAGGIAHDFNNLLTVITGRSQLLLSRLRPDDPQRRHVELIQKTADRAASLTQQLLAFSRKQVLQPKVLDLNAVVTGMGAMLRRLIGEDVELVTQLDPALRSVRADQGQLEQVILNLAVNARDAMPRGGRLLIETTSAELGRDYVGWRGVAVQPGPYAVLAVSDTGVGMDAATQARAFEPFFTTKGTGKGTGLGLATVYGIVKQSDGYVWVYSEPGQGTTLKIYLPIATEAAPALPADASRPPGPRGSETILLVEDEDGLRDLAREILERYGYVVLEAAHGGEVLEAVERHGGPVHLLVTDVVMPLMSGREVAERVARRYPDIKVLYMSGYTDDAIVHHGVLDAGIAFLQKPFTPDALARKVREVLDSVHG